MAYSIIWVNCFSFCFLSDIISGFMNLSFSQENIPILFWWRHNCWTVQRFVHLIERTAIGSIWFHQHHHCHRPRRRRCLHYRLPLTLQYCWCHCTERLAVSFVQYHECKWCAAMQYSKISSNHWQMLSTACHLCWKSSESCETKGLNDEYLRTVKQRRTMKTTNLLTFRTALVCHACVVFANCMD